MITLATIVPLIGWMLEHYYYLKSNSCNAASTQDHIQIACVPVSMEESNSLERHVA
jgi:hypothetical protein